MNVPDNVPARECTRGSARGARLLVDLDVLNGVDSEGLRAVVMALEAKDPYTAAHQRRVSRLASVMATEIGLPDSDSQMIGLTAAIHDIGKSCVPARILNKPDRLNDFEMNIMRGHPQLGHDMLKEIRHRWPVARVVLQHHERLDGSGYPLGLRGDEILPQAHLISVADVFAAMTSERPHRGALPVEAAVSHLMANRGRLYDAEAVDACVWLVTIKGFQPA